MGEGSWTPRSEGGGCQGFGFLGLRDEGIEDMDFGVLGKKKAGGRPVGAQGRRRLGSRLLSP